MEEIVKITFSDLDATIEELEGVEQTEEKDHEDQYLVMDDTKEPKAHQSGQAAHRHEDRSQPELLRRYIK